MARRLCDLRLWCRFLSTSASTASSAPPVGVGSSAEVGVQEFLKAVGKGVEAHAEKVANEYGSFSDFLQLRSGRLKKLGIPCQQRKLIMSYTEKYRRGVWRPRAVNA
ncbi:hypothetical protein MPTK1_4g18890 [Marchantia polymorpha subsp. ruderalis]|uniref:Small ribosomal subunit protein mS41 SAM domain-containing protein n=2 Tax=Marchantia polymorpha TaxID=3197 RepID=A0AAF6BBE3_MARPO|nr:hypothetical protein MARPO_0164s0021 [Marchantia polymorpha]BBN09327.1 hypothetical protein Mp_4g18890 [Marchantia polymorpha subsp. ruderalis]|eukprot:PTQ28428.1 hypothetical protein MARPO_0164s0021 [Marchantia polymorpha]